MSKIIIADVDGTVLDYLGHLPESADKAIKAARAKGHRFYICTGRAKAQMYDNIKSVNIDGIIGGNGSYVEDNGEMIMELTIEIEDCRKIVDWLNERHVPFIIESNNGLFGSPSLEAFYPELRKVYLKSIGKDENMPVPIEKVFPGMVFGGELHRGDANKISYFLIRPDLYEEAKNAFPNLTSRTWGPNPQKPVAGELALKDVTKGKAVDKLIEHLGASIEDTIAFGDADVDISLLEHCKTKVAMGNSSDGVKAIADLVTDRVDEDGLFKAFVKLGLIEQ